MVNLHVLATKRLCVIPFKIIFFKILRNCCNMHSTLFLRFLHKRCYQWLCHLGDCGPINLEMYNIHKTNVRSTNSDNLVAFWGYHIHLLYNNLLSPNYSYCILHNHLHCSTPVISFCYLIITQLYNYCINTVASDAFVISGS